MQKLKSVPLNDSTRTTIVDGIIKASPEQKALNKHKEKGRALMLKLSDLDLKGHKKAYRSLPVEIAQGHKSVSIFNQREWCARVPLPKGTCSPKESLSIHIAPTKFKQILLDWINKNNDLTIERDQAREKVYAAIAAFNSTKELLEEIPAAMQFLPAPLKSTVNQGGLPVSANAASQEVINIVAASANNLSDSAAQLSEN